MRVQPPLLKPSRLKHSRAATFGSAHRAAAVGVVLVVIVAATGGTPAGTAGAASPLQRGFAQGTAVARATVAAQGTAVATEPSQGSGNATDAARSPAPSAENVAAAGMLAGRLNCPLCQGYTLRDCPLVVCSQMRELIVQKLADGESEEVIIAYFVEQYGPQVLNQPLTSGFQLAAWVVPVAVLLIAFSTAVVLVRRTSGKKVPVAKGAVPAPNSLGAAPADPGAEARAQQLEAMLGERK